MNFIIVPFIVTKKLAVFCFVFDNGGFKDLKFLVCITCLNFINYFRHKLIYYLKNVLKYMKMTNTVTSNYKILELTLTKLIQGHDIVTFSTITST